MSNVNGVCVACRPSVSHQKKTNKDVERRPPHRVERGADERGVYRVRARDAVRGEQRDDLERAEPACVVEPVQDRRHVVRRDRNEAVDGERGRVRASGEELEARRALVPTHTHKSTYNTTDMITKLAYGTVAQTDGSGELDEVACADRGVFGQERKQLLHRDADADVGAVVGLVVGEQEHGSVGASAAGSYGSAFSSCKVY